MKGGRGRIRAWATREAALLRVLGAYMLRLNLRTTSSRHPKVVVLKQIIGLKQAAAGIPVGQAALAGPLEDEDATEDAAPGEELAVMLEIPALDSQQARDDEAMEQEEENEAKQDHGPTTATGSLAEPAIQDQGPTTGSLAEPARQDQGPTTATAGSLAEPASRDQGPTTATGSSTEPAIRDQGPTTATGSSAEPAIQDQGPTAATGSISAASQDQESTQELYYNSMGSGASL